MNDLQLRVDWNGRRMMWFVGSLSIKSWTKANILYRIFGQKEAVGQEDLRPSGMTVFHLIGIVFTSNNDWQEWRVKDCLQSNYLLFPA